mmetsp:Transcript_135150/g.235004  ORF Transcript_135150/g.235004 Transcript_135150/m.235004 type:complete len:82 (-) Transcript_135150:65-310(-)
MPLVQVDKLQKAGQPELTSKRPGCPSPSDPKLMLIAALLPVDKLQKTGQPEPTLRLRRQRQSMRPLRMQTLSGLGRERPAT